MTIGPQRTLRVALGPLDPAGVGCALATGLAARGHHPELVTWFGNPYGYRTDLTLDTRAARARFAWGAPGRFDVLHGLGGRSWFSYLDLAWARVRGRVCVLQYNGSDCRTSEIARRLHPARARVVKASRDRNVRLHQRLGARVAHAALVQDLELASYLLPRYRTIYVLPFAIDLQKIERARKAAPPQPQSQRVSIFHAPSSRRIKGSETVERTVATLSEVTSVEFISVTGRPHLEVLEQAARADIVIDQLNAETPGVFSAEAMALGKPVLCECDPRKLASFARPTPVVAATAETLFDRLLELCREVDRRRDLGERGRRYALDVHAPVRAAAAAENAYVHARDRPAGVFEAVSEGIRKLDPITDIPGVDALGPAAG
jgi:hypothetical protein